MIITKESGTIYQSIDGNVIDFHDDNDLTLAVVDRSLSYDGDGLYIDDITDDEINLGIDAIRAFLYREESDPIFFQHQRGEADESDWTNAIADIKERYPKIETE